MRKKVDVELKQFDVVESWYREKVDVVGKNSCSKEGVLCYGKKYVFVVKNVVVLKSFMVKTIVLKRCCNNKNCGKQVLFPKKLLLW